MSEASSKHTIVPKCEDCGWEMKPLWTSYFCPNDCDQKPDVDDGWTRPYFSFDGEDTLPFCVRVVWRLPRGIRTPLLDSEIRTLETHPWFQCVSTIGTKTLTFTLGYGKIIKLYDVEYKAVGACVRRIT